MTENIQRRQMSDLFNSSGGNSMDLLSAGALAMQGLNLGASIMDGGHSARKTARSLMNYQQELNLKNWNLQNDYNHPMNQLARLREANLNPNFITGGNAGNAGELPSAQVPSGLAEHMNFAKVMQLAARGAIDAMEIVQGMDQRHLTTEGMRLANQKAMVDLQQAQHDLSMRQKYDDDYYHGRNQSYIWRNIMTKIQTGLAEQQYDFNAKVAQDRANKIRYDANLQQLRYDNQKFENEIMNPLRQQLADQKIQLSERQIEQLGWNIKNTILQGGLLALNYEQLDTMLHGDILDQLGAQNWGQAITKVLVNLFTGIGSRWLGGNARKY